MRTPYDEENGDFSEQAHYVAREDLYPTVFNDLFGSGRADAIDFEIEYHGNADADTPHDLDGEHGIDATISIDCGPRCPIPIYVQERFRRPDYQRWQDIVLTEWNRRSGKPSELGKIKADHFVYGYYDPNAEEILEALVVDVAGVKCSLIEGEIQYDNSKENPKQQTMVAISFDELARSNIQYLHYRDGSLHYNGYDIGQNDETQDSDQSIVVPKESVQSVFVGGEQ